jgi:hypothetical protein
MAGLAALRRTALTADLFDDADASAACRSGLGFSLPRISRIPHTLAARAACVSGFSISRSPDQSVLYKK